MYSVEEKEQAVAAWISNGECLRRAAKALGYPHQTIHNWYTHEPEWWASTAEKFRQQYEAEHRAKIREIIVAGLDEQLDRIKNGDERVTTKGERIRVKMSGRDIAIAVGTMIDKYRLSLGQPTSIAAKGEKSSVDKLESLREAARTRALEEGKASGKVAEIKQVANDE